MSTSLFRNKNSFLKFINYLLHKFKFLFSLMSLLELILVDLVDNKIITRVKVFLLNNNHILLYNFIFYSFQASILTFS